jgi:uncharacterized protein (TIGR01777 family)
VKIVVTGASGLIGQALLRRLHADGHTVVQLVRREPGGPGEARWDPAAGDVDVAALAGVEAAVNLSGAGVGDHRWTPAYQHEIRQSRIDATRTLASALAAQSTRPSVLVNASAVGYYGDRGDEVLLESSPPGDTFLAGVAQDWEAATSPASDAGIRVACLRTGLVMSRDGGAFGARLLPLFRLGLGGRLGDGRMWWSWVTVDDVVGAIGFLVENDVDGPVNLTAPEPRRNADVTKALARALHRPAVFVVPRPALRVGLGGFAEEVLSSHRAVPQRLLDAGYRFRHPDLDSACAYLAGR